MAHSHPCVMRTEELPIRRWGADSEVVARALASRQLPTLLLFEQFALRSVLALHPQRDKSACANKCKLGCFNYCFYVCLFISIACIFLCVWTVWNKINKLLLRKSCHKEMREIKMFSILTPRWHCLSLMYVNGNNLKNLFIYLSDCQFVCPLCAPKPFVRLGWSFGGCCSRAETLHCNACRVQLYSRRYLSLRRCQQNFYQKTFLSITISRRFCPLVMFLIKLA